ncbi:IS3 family transposase [Escherichia coli]|nr:IS3 family transposase [Escherichia coli]CAD6112714.1 IS3 family transposase [Escherichia coli]
MFTEEEKIRAIELYFKYGINHGCCLAFTSRTLG